MLGNNNKNNNFEYISLQEATRLCNYSQEYLSLRARQGKLKSVKLGRNWVTTKGWLQEYIGKVDEYNDSINNGNGHKNKKSAYRETEQEIVKDQIVYSPPENLPIARYPKLKLNLGTLRPSFVASLVLVLIMAGGVFGKEALFKTYNDIARSAEKIVQNVETLSGDVFTATVNYKDVLGSVSDNLLVYGQVLKNSYSLADKKIEEKFGNALLSLAPENFFREYASADRKIEQKFSDVLSTITNGYSLADRAIEEALFGLTNDIEDSARIVPGQLNDFVKQKIVKAGHDFKNFREGFKSETMRLVRQIAEPFVRAYKFFAKSYQFLTLPWKEVAPKELSEEVVVVKRVEVSKVVESIKEVTRETIQQVTKVDDAALVQIRDNIAYLETEIGKRLYAPGGVVSQTIYVTEPVSSPKIYQENGEIVLQTLGSGNVILTAATGLQLYGQQVVIESTNILNPLIYLASKTKVGGDMTIAGKTNIGGELGVGGATSITGNLTVTGALSSTGSQTIGGNLTVSGTGNSTFAGPIVITTSTASQLKLSYDSSNYTNFGTNSVGDLTITPSGEDVTITGNLLVTGSPSYTGGASFLVPVTITTTSVPQFLVRYDADNELNLEVASDGAVSFLATGTDADLTLSTESFADAFFIDDSTGRIGIATTSPRYKLDVWGDLAVGTSTATNSDAIVPAFYVTSKDRPQIGIGTSTVGNALLTVGTTTSSLVVASNGFVGIGTTSPRTNLEVNGSIRILDGSKIIFGSGVSGNEDDYLTLSDTSSSGALFNLIQDTASKLYIQGTTGNVGIATTSPRYKLDVWGDLAIGTSTDTNTPLLYVDSGTGYGGVGIGTTTLSGNLFTVGTSTPLFVVASNGYVGIGTTTPEEALTVVGNTLISGNIVTVSGDIMPSSPRAQDLGSAAYDWANIYTDNLYANNIGAASTSVSGTTMETFTINSDAAADATSSLRYYRGTDTPHALLTWDANYDRFNFNFPLYFSGTGNLSAATALTLSSAGSSDIILTSANNVGIATTSPRYKLDVWGDLAIGTSTDTNTPLLYVDSGTGYGGVGIGTTTLSTNLLTVGTTTPSLIVANNGYVGIGTTTPTSMLSVYSVSAAPIYFNRIGGAGGASLSIDNIVSTADIIYTPIPNATLSGGHAFYVNNGSGPAGNKFALGITGGDGGPRPAGYVSIGTTTARYKLDVWGDLAIGTSTSTNIPALYVDSGSGGRIGIGTTTLSGLLTVGTTTSALVVDPRGYVGVGTTTPTALFSVSGDAYISGTLTVGGASLGNIQISDDTWIGLGAAGGRLVFDNQAPDYLTIQDAILGIATTSPRYTLDVWGDLAVGTSTGVSAPMSYPLLYVNSGEGGSSNGVGIGTTTVTGTMLTVGTTTPALVVANSGYVGIGTVNPSSKLEIQGGYILIPRATAVDNASYGLVRSSEDDFLFNGNYINQYGFGFHDPATAGQDGAYMSGYYGIDLFTGGASRLHITSVGNVGIGTAGPSELLTVFSATDPTLQIGTGSATSTISGLTTATSTIISGLSAGNNAAFVVNQAAAAGSLYVAANGNVGIGTTTPSYILDVYQATGNTTLRIQSAGADSVPNIELRNDAIVWLLKSNGNSDDQFIIREGGVADWFAIAKTTGNVGISTTSPRYKLDVWGDLAIGTSTGVGVAMNYPLLYVNSGEGGSSNGVGIGTTTVTGTMLTVGTTTPALVVANSGYVGIGTTVPASKLNVVGTSGAGTRLTFTDAGTARYGYIEGGDDAAITSYVALGTQANSEVMRIRAGNVGIGTTTPRYKLDVWGDLAIGTSTGVGVAMNYPLLYVASAGVSNSGKGVGIGTTTVSGTMLTVGTTTPALVVANSGYVGVGTASPTSLLTIAGDAYISGNVGIGTTTPYSKLTINESNDFAFGDFNASTVDTMEASALRWTQDTNSVTSTESTIVKAGSQSLKIAASGASEDDVVFKSYVNPENFSARMERLGFWIYADKVATSSATTTQLISIGIYNSANGASGTSTKQIYIQEANKWQYEEWNISGLQNATSIDRLFFRIDVGNISTVNFYIDQIRLYNSGERSGEMFVGKDGSLVLMGRGAVEIGRVDGSSNKPGIRVDSATVEFNQPVSVNTGGDVGINYDLQFLSTGLSQITSEGPLRIAAGDSNHSENLTLTTGGSGDVIVELSASSSAFMVTHAWAASTTVPFIINSESNSTTTAEMDKLGILFQVISDYSSDENTVFSIDASGNFYYDRSAHTPAADVAENYYVQDESIKGGDVVCLAGTPLTVEKCSSAYESDLIGVVSTQPALLMGNDLLSARPVALNGRVPVKVSIEGGVIAIGDSLTSASSTPGVAMKSTGSGKILGYALESFDGSSTSSDMIYAFINLQDRSSGDLTVFENSEGNIEVKTMTQNGEATLFSIDGEGAMVVGKIKTQQLCVGSVCVTENEFMQVFGAGAGLALTPDTNTTTSEADASTTEVIVPELPNSVIDSSPQAVTTSTEATFEFHSNKTNSTFSCQLNGSMWAGCSSPQTYTGLAIGLHQFQVQAIDVDNQAEPSPSVVDWEIIAEQIIIPEISTSTATTTAPEDLTNSTTTAP